MKVVSLGHSLFDKELFQVTVVFELRTLNLHVFLFPHSLSYSPFEFSLRAFLPHPIVSSLFFSCSRFSFSSLVSI